MKQSKRINKWLMFCLAFWIGLFSILAVLIPDIGFSSVENRTLASRPVFTLKTLWDGAYGKDAEAWYADQFPLRTSFFRMNYLVRKIMGQKEINNVFLGHGALLANPLAGNEAIMQENMNAAAGFAYTTKIPTSVLIVPSAAQIQTQKLPANAPVQSQAQYLQAASEMAQPAVWLDPQPVLQEHAKESLYYKTDHHMTSFGAALAAGLLMDSIGETLDIDSFEFMPVSTSFQGTLASKTGSFLMKDTIEIAVSQNNPDYLVSWADGSMSASIYQSAALEQKDQYQLFLGANQSLIHIETNLENDLNLLIFKDSYANEMVQFLLPYCKSITLLDPRYFYDDLDLVIETYQINQAAIIYSSDLFLTQSKLADVIATLDLFELPVSDEPEESAAASESEMTAEETDLQPQEAQED